jgi:hypothetical protein
VLPQWDIQLRRQVLPERDAQRRGAVLPQWDIQLRR